MGCEPKGHWFDSQSGHRPGSRARSPVEDTWKAITHWCFSPSLSPSLPFSLKINKTFKRGQFIKKKKKNSCNENLEFWQKGKSYIACGFLKAYLIATPPAGERGTQLLDAHDLSHVLERGVTGHQIIVGKLVFFHYSWKHDFLIIFSTKYKWKSNIHTVLKKKFLWVLKTNSGCKTTQ